MNRPTKIIAVVFASVVRGFSVVAAVAFLFCLTGCRTTESGAFATLADAQERARENQLEIRADDRVKRLLLEYNEAATLSMLGDLDALGPETSPARRSWLYWTALEHAVLYNMVLNAADNAAARNLVRRRESERIDGETETLARRIAARKAEASGAAEELEFEWRSLLALPRTRLPRRLPAEVDPSGTPEALLFAAAVNRADAPELAGDPGLRSAAERILRTFRDGKGDLSVGTVIRRLFYLQSQRYRNAGVCAGYEKELTALTFLTGVAAEIEVCSAARAELDARKAPATDDDRLTVNGLLRLSAPGNPEGKNSAPTLSTERVEASVAAFLMLLRD